jgi:putative hydrolase of the HAD superfamily
MTGSATPSFSTIFFDLDDTLYAAECGLWEAIRGLMNRYLHERLGFTSAQVAELRHHYYLTYGTTLRGLQIHHQVDTDDFLARVHDLPIDQYLRPLPELRALLLSLPQARWIFTNADADHAGRVLEVLGVADCFAGVIDIRDMGFECKPNPGAYVRALARAGESDPRRCLMLDDAWRNLAPAQGLGMTTGLVGSRRDGASPDFMLGSVLDLAQVMPELWTAGGGG